MTDPTAHSVCHPWSRQGCKGGKGSCQIFSWSVKEFASTFWRKNISAEISPTQETDTSLPHQPSFPTKARHVAVRIAPATGEMPLGCRSRYPLLSRKVVPSQLTFQTWINWREKAWRRKGMERQSKKWAHGENMWDKTALFCQFTGGPDPLEIKMTPEEDMGRDPQQVQFRAMYVALAKFNYRNRQKISCRKAKFIAPNLLQVLEATVVQTLALSGPSTLKWCKVA